MSDREHPTTAEPMPARRDPEPPVPEPTGAQTAVAVEVPDAVKQAEVAKDIVKERLDAVRSRGVTWVRPSDLLTRGASVVAGRGIAWNTAMGVRARSGLAAGARAVAGRVRRLPPLSAFGRGRSQEAQVRSGVGMR